jgi:hypothetical protein
MDIDIPWNVREMKTYLRHYPPETGGESRVFVDDISYIQWGSAPVSFNASNNLRASSNSDIDLQTPNGWEFVRCMPENNTSEVSVTLTGRVYKSSHSSPLVTTISKNEGARQPVECTSPSDTGTPASIPFVGEPARPAVSPEASPVVSGEQAGQTDNNESSSPAGIFK